MSTRIKVTNYQEILEDFSTIKSVKICGTNVQVSGLAWGETKTRIYSYTNKSVAKFVAQKINYFKGIK